MAHCVSSVRPFQQYGGDDVSHVIMDWRPKNCIAHVYMSRVAHRATQTITITGAKGTLTVDGPQVIHYDDEGRQLSKTVHQCIEKNIIRKMVLEFGDWAAGRTETFSTSLEDSQDTVLVVDAIKASLTSHQVQHPLLLSKRKSSITTDRKMMLRNAAPRRGYTCSTSASLAESVKRFTLNTGSTIPMVGLGTRSAKSPGEVREAVRIALRIGYRHIDIAESSGNEREIAAAIKDSGIPRNEIWITTKLDNRWHIRVDQAVERSLARLDTTFVDLYLMHWPICIDPDNPPRQLTNWNFVDTWRELQKIPRSQVRNIGVSNFGISHLETLLVDPSCHVIPAVNQVELHPHWPSPNLLNYCRKNGIHCTAYSPFGSSHSPLLQDPVLRQISRIRKRTEHQILLKWGIQRGTSVIPRSVNGFRIKENLDLDAFELSEEEMDRLNDIRSRFKSCGDDWLPGKVFFAYDT
ncbi:hypothetical protein N7447_009331 [Penicillium robsamsonii]|uniref:uncharacterized protein n=1 Tax=Penicillium robsamsonii TaxID=1792511 RepID=UPI002546624A|nr:uncharacterized protein N7447_009331 [Penicillium robsamsonii]KAJ5817098.1 hypothetical protein N7447_009331 [Penicillium robsamsonii]